MLSNVPAHLTRLISLLNSVVSATQMSLKQREEQMTNLPDLFQHLAEYGMKQDSTATDKFRDMVFVIYFKCTIELPIETCHHYLYENI